MWPDNETTLDLIGFKVHSDLIRAVITDKKMLPVTVGIFGDWGSGKTSIMKMLERDLNVEAESDKGNQGVACLYFNGWLFEGYDDAKAAILTSVLLQLGEHKRFGPKLRDRVVSLLKSVNWMRVARLGMQHVALPAISAYMTGGASLVPALAAQAVALTPLTTDNATEEPAAVESNGPDWEGLIRSGPNEGSPLDARSFRDRFADMLKDSDISSVVVLIDDLDRCSPDRIIDNLEAVKLFLNAENTAFVIGADPRIVRHAIATRYKPAEIAANSDESDAAQELVNDYLEKLIQVPYRLPRLSPAEVETYMVLLHCLRDLPQELAQKCLDACDKQRKDSRYGVFGYAAIEQELGTTAMPSALAKSLTFCSAAAGLITEGLKGNPRQVKRFLNGFSLRRQLATVAGLENIRDDVLVKLMVLEYGRPVEYKELFEWQTRDQGFPRELETYEKMVLEPTKGESGSGDAKPTDSNQRWTSGFMFKWLGMEPRLAGIDLRDYFWVARDRLDTTLTGLSMVPPSIRRMFDDLLSSNPSKRKQSLDLAIQLPHEQTEILVGLLEQYVRRQVAEKQGYDVLRGLVEAGVSGAAETLARVLNDLPAETMPPAVGLDVLTLVDAKPTLRDTFKKCIDRLSGTDTQIGKALKINIEKNRGRK